MRTRALRCAPCVVVFLVLLAGLGSPGFAKVSSGKRRLALQHTATATNDEAVNASAFPKRVPFTPYPPGVSSTPPPTPCATPAVCGQTCTLDVYGTPITCTNGQCSCAPGYEMQGGPPNPVCQPIQPDVIGSENVKLVGGYSCPGICPLAQQTTWAFVGSIYDAFDLVPVHGIAPGGEAFMPVWGYQATYCSNHGVLIRECQGGSNNGLTCSAATDCPSGACTLFQTCQGGPNNSLPCNAVADCPSGTCAPYKSWAGCAPDPFPLCYGSQGANPDGFNFESCSSSDGNGDCEIDPNSPNSSLLYCQEGINQGVPHHAVSADPRSTVGLCDLCGSSTAAFTSASPYLGESFLCNFHITGFDNPARFDFPNNVSVYRAPIRWEDFMQGFSSIIDDDYTWDMESQGHELFDTDTQFAYHNGCNDATHGRVHVEFASSEVVDNFTDDDWGASNQFWRDLKHHADNMGGLGDNAVSCFVKSFVNPGLSCPPDPNNPIIDDDCRWHDPMGVVVGVPSIDCADDPYQGTDEIHPVLAMAIRIQEDPTAGPEKWAFFYRQHGNAGPCGNSKYSRCLSDFTLPLGLPNVAGNGVLTGANVHVDWHKWSDETFGSGSPDISVSYSFDLTNGTLLSIHLPRNEDGVVGLVTVTPQLDTTPPILTCPAGTTASADAACHAPVPDVLAGVTVTDNCLGPFTKSQIPAAGTAETLGVTPIVVTVKDASGNPATCTTTFTVVDTTPPVVLSSVATATLWPPNHDLRNVGFAASATDNCAAKPVIAVTGIFSTEPDQGPDADSNFSPDARGVGVATLRLRSERPGDEQRVYLDVVQATDGSGNISYSCTTVGVPQSASAADLASVQVAASAASSYCNSHNGGAPAGYVSVGAGPVRGPKQ